MKGDPEILEMLNECLSAELTAINQYYGHAKMCADWGFTKLAEHHMAESKDEMLHADRLIDRILLLDGVPNMQRLFPVRIGETVPEQHQVDLDLEMDARARYNAGVAMCREKGDNGTRALLEELLVGEEEGIDWVEAQLHQIEHVGLENYLAQQL